MDVMYLYCLYVYKRSRFDTDLGDDILRSSFVVTYLLRRIKNDSDKRNADVYYAGQVIYYFNVCMYIILIFIVEVEVSVKIHILIFEWTSVECRSQFKYKCSSCCNNL